MTVRSAVRASRVAAPFELQHVAVAAGLRLPALRAALARSAAPRGRCTAIAAAVASNKDTSPRRRRAAFTHRACPPYATRSMDGDDRPKMRAAASGVAGWRGRTVAEPAAPRAVLVAAAAHQRSRSRVDAAGNRSAPLALRVGLAQDLDSSVRCKVAESRGTETSLGGLADDPDSFVRWHVAKNIHAPASLLESLATDPSAGVRSNVASNPDAHASLLESLVTDPAAGVREALAESSHAPTAALERLACDRLVDVRWRVANNFNAPAAALNRLAADKDEDVRSAVAENRAWQQESAANVSAGMGVEPAFFKATT